MAQSVPDPNDPVACVLGQPGAEDRETDFLNRRTRRDGRAIWLYQNLLPIQKRSKASCGENTSVFATLRTEARWGPLGPSGALWAPVLDFRGALCFYALGAFPPSLRGTRRHTHLRIKSPPERRYCAARRGSQTQCALRNLSLSPLPPCGVCRSV